MSDTLPVEFAGRRGHLFWLALKTSFLTLITLGLYRFWMKTRLRRYYWSSVRPGGVPLEYTGRPLEKLLGFLVAVCIMAFYIGIVNLILMFLSFAVMGGNVTGYLISFVGVIPVIFYAQYRARRYVLARTRWRGIRFGLEPGAWGFAWRSAVHWVLTILTLGLLWPRMRFWLEKYMTDRTYFGTARLEQGGRWTMLFGPALYLAVTGAAVVAASSLLAAMPAVWSAALTWLAYLWLLYGFARFRALSWQRMTMHKTAAGVGFESNPRIWRVARIYLFGWLSIGVVLAVIGLLLGMVAVAALGADWDQLTLQDATQLPTWLAWAMGVVLYFSFFLTFGALRHALISLPLWRHYAETLTVTGPAAIDGIAQRDRDEFAEAEGFAEALDLGAAI